MGENGTETGILLFLLNNLTIILDNCKGEGMRGVIFVLMNISKSLTL